MCGIKAGNQSNAVDQIKSLFNLLAWIFAQKNPGNLSSDLGDPVTVHIAPEWEISQNNCISSCKIYRYSTAGQVLMSDSLKSPYTHAKDVLHLHVKWTLWEQQEVSIFYVSLCAPLLSVTRSTLWAHQTGRERERIVTVPVEHDDVQL